MTDSDPLLDRAAIEDAFRRLGERLARRGVIADIYVFGGAAMALAYLMGSCWLKREPSRTNSGFRIGGSTSKRAPTLRQVVTGMRPEYSIIPG